MGFLMINNVRTCNAGRSFTGRVQSASIHSDCQVAKTFLQIVCKDLQLPLSRLRSLCIAILTEKFVMRILSRLVKCSNDPNQYIINTGADWLTELAFAIHIICHFNTSTHRRLFQKPVFPGKWWQICTCYSTLIHKTSPQKTNNV